MKNLYIKKSKINGSGLHTNELIKKNELVGMIHGQVEIVRKFTPKLSALSWNWIGIGRFSWINTKDSPFKYINHSCDPNTYIKSKRLVVALKNISAGEELTMDYSLTEADPGFVLPGGCTCGSKKCRSEVGPVYSLPKIIFNAKKNFIPQAFKKIYSVEEKKRHR